MEHVFPALELLLRFDTLLVAIAGTVAGVLMGVLPGVGSVLALTVVLPFTFSMGQVPSVVLLLAVYCGSVYGGSVSAILINTPGTPQSAATCLDGYPMARRGDADLALGWATVASVIGGLFSIVVLVLAAPQLAAFALQFGPIETFSLILLALTCIATVSRGSMIKGLLAGVVGLFLAMIGPDIMTGDIRFTFDMFQLSSGITQVPALVGIFALSEVFLRAGSRWTGVDEVKVRVGFRVAPWSEWKKRWKVILKSCGFGSFIGVLPGTGATVASFISYADAKRTSPRKDKFGTGEPDGIIASEAANNAVTGGALVPTLALGIPGDAITAVMMSTLLIQGITPGVRLFVDNPDIVYAAFLSLILINVLIFFVAWGGAHIFTRLLRLPEPLLMACVAVLALVGAYVVRGNPFDLIIAVGAGILGLLMRLGGFPPATLVIGLILAPQLEETLRQGLIVTNGSFLEFFASPLALVFLMTTVMLLAWPLLRKKYSRKNKTLL